MSALASLSPPVAPTPIATSTPAPAPAWVTPDRDLLFGIDAVARYLVLSFNQAGWLIGRGAIPTWKSGRAHTTRRSTLAGHFAALERRQVPAALIAPLPVNVAPDGAMGLVRGLDAMAAHIGCTHDHLRHRRAGRELPAFRVGQALFARRASLDLWRASHDAISCKVRRQASCLARRRAACPPGYLSGGAAIGAHLGWPAQKVFREIAAGRLPAIRIGNGLAADPAALAHLHPSHDLGDA